MGFTTRMTKTARRGTALRGGTNAAPSCQREAVRSTELRGMGAKPYSARPFTLINSKHTSEILLQPPPLLSLSCPLHHRLDAISDRRQRHVVLFEIVEHLRP